MKIIVVSGGFDPLHSGHISYFKSAKNLGNKLIVALNSDSWLINKKEKYFMPFNERKEVIENLSCVDKVIDFEDDDIGSCINALKKVKKLYVDDEIIFCNGGDRNNTNCPEMQVDGIEFIFGVGGDTKKNSSSWILKKWQYDSEERLWGSFYNLFTHADQTNVKVKELIVLPGKGMSFQRHDYRSEIWFISKGSCIVNYSEIDSNNPEIINLKLEDTFFVKKGAWHQIINPSNYPCHIIEIQYGEKTEEDDIERLYYYDEKK